MRALLAIASAAVLVGAAAPSGTEKAMELTSTAFQQNTEMPKRFTCDGGEISPPLAWSGAPQGTKSFVLIVDDPDAPDPAAPKRVWVHWVLYDIPATADSLAEGVAPKNLPPGTQQGLNDWKKTGFGGPCPPVGKHRYFHKLYALDTVLTGLRNPAKAQIEKAMEGHVLAKAELVGLYQRK